MGIITCRQTNYDRKDAIPIGKIMRTHSACNLNPLRNALSVQSMKLSFRVALVALLILVASTGRVSSAQVHSHSTSMANASQPTDKLGLANAPAPNSSAKLMPRHFSLPLSFELNRGQTVSAVKYLGRADGFSVAFRENEAEFYFVHPTNLKSRVRETSGVRHVDAQTDLIQMRFIGANGSAAVEGEERLPGNVNYFVGKDPTKWRSDVPTFGEVRYSSLYPGVDLVYYGADQHLEFDFRLAPGADPRKVLMDFKGARKVTLDPVGDLIIVANGGSVGFRKPVIYQLAADGSRQMIQGSFSLESRNIVGFRLGRYDHSRPLVIDPILNYSLYFGGASNATAIAVNSTGEVYITGTAAQMPTTAGSFQAAVPAKPYPYFSPFIAKLNSTGTALLYCTYISGTNDDQSYALAVDAQGDAYIAGRTNSTHSPVTKGAFQTQYPATAGEQSEYSNGTAFVTELNPTGNALVYSTYLGGSLQAWATAITVDDNNSAYVAGTTYDSDFPTTPGAFQLAPTNKPVGQNSAFVTKLNPAGSALVYSTYLRGSAPDFAYGIAVDSSGNAHVGGTTLSTDFPTTKGAYQTIVSGNTWGAILSKVNSTGTGLLYSTYLGQNNGTVINAVEVDPSGDTYVTGYTYDTNFPATPGVFQPKISEYNGFAGTDSFVTKFNSTGSSLVYSTFLGGSNDGMGGVGDDIALAIAIDANGNAYVAGSSGNLDFPVTPGAYETENLALLNSGEGTAFLSKISHDASTLLYSTFLGGTGDQTGEGGEGVSGIALGPAGNVYLAGVSASVDFPLTPGVIQTQSPGYTGGAFVTEFNAAEMITLPAPTFAISSNANSVEYGTPVTFTAKVEGAGGTTPTGIVGFSNESIEPGDSGGSGSGMGTWNDKQLDASGTATFTPSTLEPGTLSVAAYYLGDSNDAPALAIMTETVTKIPTTTTITASANPIAYGSGVTFTAKVLDNTGKPAVGQAWFEVGNIIYYEVPLDNNGGASWTVSPSNYPLAVGANTVTALYIDSVSPFQYKQTSGSLVETVNSLGAAPAPTFSPAAGSYTSVQHVSLSDSVNNATIYYTTDGTVPSPTDEILYTNGQPIEVSSTETVQAVAIAPGYTASSVASAAYTINLTPPSFAISGPTISVVPGATAGNTSTITLTPSGGFTGTISLSCAVTPMAASDPATCSIPASVTISGTSAQTTTLTVNTTAANSAFNQTKKLFWPSAGGAAVACILLFGIPARRGRWQGMLGILLLLFSITGSVMACGGGGGGGGDGGGGNPGTTAGAYTMTVTGTSGTITESGTVTLTVQ